MNFERSDFLREMTADLAERRRDAMSTNARDATSNDTT